MTETSAWFDLEDGAAVPRSHAHAPWSEDMLHGRLLAGLAARGVEAGHLDDGWLPARLTIDMFRSPPMAPITVDAERIRDGGRVRVVDLSLGSGGRELARARALIARTDDRQLREVWSTKPWDLPHPETLVVPDGMEDNDVWEFREGPEGFFGSARSRGWTRDNAQLLAGETVTPFVRVATAADLASPVANWGDGGLDFINADITLNLARLPVSDWIGFETIFHRNAAGVSAASCAVHDLDGPIGLSTVSSVIY